MTRSDASSDWKRNQNWQAQIDWLTASPDWVEWCQVYGAMTCMDGREDTV